MKSARLGLLATQIKREIKETSSRMVASLSFYVTKNFNDSERPGSVKTSSKSNPFGYIWVGGQNNTSKLYVNSGVLLRSFITGQKYYNSEMTVTDSSLVFEVGSLVPYAFVHEFGNSSMNIKARPFMTPAMNELNEVEIEELKKRLLELLEKAIK